MINGVNYSDELKALIPINSNKDIVLNTEFGIERLKNFSFDRLNDGDGWWVRAIWFNNILIVDGQPVPGLDFGVPEGIVGSVNVAGNSLTLSSSDGAWGPANQNHYAIGPTKTIDNVKRYLNLDASLNVIGLTDDDSYTRTPANTATPKISFPATLDNGEAPDTALPFGTSIQTEFKAENTALAAMRWSPMW